VAPRDPIEALRYELRGMADSQPETVAKVLQTLAETEEG
jgi:flagellar biosynthesis/type III secretory pathway M-ring protein FliF/YscJ